MVETSDGGYALAGITNSFGAGEDDFWLVKTDDFGNMEWNQTYGGTKWDRVHSLIETSDGGYAMAGFTGSFSGGGDDLWLIKTDASGNMEWNQTYGGKYSYTGSSLVQTSDGGYALAGDIYYTNETKNFDFCLVKLDASENMEWQREYGKERDERAYSLVETSDGGYVLAGTTDSFGELDNDFWLIKTDEQGIPEFPSWIILPLFLIATLFAIVFKKKLYHQRSQKR